MSDKEARPIDYIALAFFYTAALIEGIWQGLRQIPGYVRARARSYRRRVERKQKERVDGKTPRERRLDAIRPGQPEE